jgi:hypothetical protein
LVVWRNTGLGGCGFAGATAREARNSAVSALTGAGAVVATVCGLTAAAGVGVTP